MTTYKEIFGKQIKFLSSDLSDASATGQIWYNSTAGKFKSIVAAEATSSAAPLNTTRGMCAGGGIQTAAWLCGGTTGAPTSGTTHTENYNGSGWATSASMSNARAHFGATGTQTAGLAVAGGPPFSPSPGGAQSNVEEYDGEAWSAGGAIPTNVWSNSCFGVQTAAVSAGSEPNTTNYVFDYDGSSWTGGGTMNTVRSYLGSAGTETAGLVFGGSTPANALSVESYDGNNWTTEPNSIAVRYSMFCGGVQTSALKAGGVTYVPAGTGSAAVETYDGTSWATSPATLATGRGYSKGQTQNSPSNSAGLFAGGTTTHTGAQSVSSTEEYNVTTNIITAAAWSSGGNLPTAVAYNQGGGIQTAALSMSGQPATTPTATPAVFEYDGSSWAAGGSLPAPAGSYGGQASKNGTQTAMLYWKGHESGNKNTVSSYDGSSWTAQSTFPNTDVYGGGCGTLTAALSVAGAPPPGGAIATCFESDGSYNWTAGGSLGTARYNNDAVGIQTNAVTAGGQTPSNIAKTEEYNGSSWSEKSDMIASRTGVTKDQCFGTNSDDMMVAGGPPNSALCIQWDGTAWSTRPSLGTARHGGAGAGASTTSGVIAGGTSPHKTATEEFNGETTAVNIVNVTTS